MAAHQRHSAGSPSTVVGCNTRRYHGLLVAATLPPVGRIMTLSRLGEILILDGDRAALHELAVNQFRDNFHPRGDQYLRNVSSSTTPRTGTTRSTASASPRNCRSRGSKTSVGMRYTIEPADSRASQLPLVPFCALRDFHCDCATRTG